MRNPLFVNGRFSGLALQGHAKLSRLDSLRGDVAKVNGAVFITRK